MGLASFLAHIGEPDLKGIQIPVKAQAIENTGE
jgi:hypothetical protein